MTLFKIKNASHLSSLLSWINKQDELIHAPVSCKTGSPEEKQAPNHLVAFGWKPPDTNFGDVHVQTSTEGLHAPVLVEKLGTGLMEPVQNQLVKLKNSSYQAKASIVHEKSTFSPNNNNI